MRGMILILSIALCSFAATAQNSIDGTWLLSGHETDDNIGDGQVDGSGEMKMEGCYVFNGDSYSTDMKAIITMDFSPKDDEAAASKQKLELYIEVSAANSGSLTLEGDVLTLTPAPGQKPKIEVNTRAEGIPAGGLIKSMVVGPLKRELAAEMKKTDRMRVVSVTAETLVLEDILSDKELKKGNTPERMTLNRKR